MMAAERYRVVCPDNDYSHEVPTAARAAALLAHWERGTPEKGHCALPHHIEHDVWRDGAWVTEVIA